MSFRIRVSEIRVTAAALVCMSLFAITSCYGSWNFFYKGNNVDERTKSLTILSDRDEDFEKSGISKLGGKYTVLVMTVHPGYGGQEFIEETVAKIAELKKYIDDNNLENEIEVDGGINFDTIVKCKDAGAERAVVGSFLANAKDINYTMNKLKNS